MPKILTDIHLGEIDAEIIFASEEAADSHKFAMNSYNAGYDAGLRDGLEKARKIINDETDD